MCAPCKNSSTSTSPFPYFVPFHAPHLFCPHLVTLWFNSGLLCPSHKLFVLLKLHRAATAAFHPLGHRAEPVLLSLLGLVCVPGAKENSEQALPKAWQPGWPCCWRLRAAGIILEASFNGLSSSYGEIFHGKYAGGEFWVLILLLCPCTGKYQNRPTSWSTHFIESI